MSRRLVLDPRRVPTVPVRINPERAPRGLAGAWLLNDLSGRDYGPFGNRGTLVGSPTIGGTSRGPVMSFNGTNQYVTIPSSATYDFTTGSYYAEFSTTKTGVNQDILRRDGVNISLPRQFALRVNTANKLEFIAIWGSIVTIDSTLTVTDGARHTAYVEISFNGTSTSLAMWLDNALAATGSVSGAMPAASGVPLTIGALSGGIEPFRGPIGNVQISKSIGRMPGLYTAPYAMFEPLQQRTFVDLLAGGATPTTLAPASGIAVARGAAPSVTWGTVLTPAPGIAIARSAPPSITWGTTLTPAPGISIATGIAPSITWGTTLAPAAGVALALGALPSVTWDTMLAPGAGVALASGTVPTVTFSSTDTTLYPGVGAAYAAGIAPTVAVYRLATLTAVPAFSRTTTVPPFSRTTIVPRY